MYAYNDNPNIIIELDETDNIESIGQILECLAYGDTDFLEMVNEGFPTYYGNSYATYAFYAMQDGFIYEYAIGPNELDMLRDADTIILEPTPWNDLDTVRECLPWVNC